MITESLPSLVDRRAEEAADEVALTFDDGQLTYGELADRSARAARMLKEHGVGAGDRVLIAVGNALDLPVALIGAARIRALLVPLNWRHRGDVLRFMTSHADPALVLCDTALLDAAQVTQVEQACPGAPMIQSVSGGSDFLASLEGFEPIVGKSSQPDPLAIIFTSGTTGRSKGAVLSQGFFLREADAFLRVVEPRDGDSLWTVLPLFHTNALCLTLTGGLLARTPVVVRHGFSARRFWDMVRADGASVVNLLGAMVPILLKVHPAAIADHPVRLVVGGGVAPQTVRDFSTRFHVDFREVYGMTETGLNAGQTNETKRAGSVGRSLGHWEIRVDAPPGRAGEIQIRALEPGGLFEEYWRDRERTEAAFTRDGFFRTGDLGTLDAEGFLEFRGRLKDCIRRGGENISPTEVELAVSQHPEVAECAAVAVPSELAEDEVKIAYVLRPGRELSAEELHAFCWERMAAFMVPRFYEQLDALPKTETEKVERFRLGGTGAGVRDLGATRTAS